MQILGVGFLVLGWGYFLNVLKRAKLSAFHFLWGSIGLFLILVLISQHDLFAWLAETVAYGAKVF